ALLKRSQEALLFVDLDEPHRPAFEAEFGELPLVDFDEDVDDGVAEAAELVFAFHCWSFWCPAVDGELYRPPSTAGPPTYTNHSSCARTGIGQTSHVAW